MKPSTLTAPLFALALLGYAAIADGEIADAVYRDGVLRLGPVYVNWHTGLIYGYDNGTKNLYVIEADNDAGGVAIDLFDRPSGPYNEYFMGDPNNHYMGARCPEYLALPLRQLVLYFASSQIGVHYWDIGAALGAGWFICNFWSPLCPWGGYLDPTWKRSGSGFRCDGLVEWAYEQIGFNACNCQDAHLYNDYGAVTILPQWGPWYQWSQMSPAIQMPPVAWMVYPPSTDFQNPTTNCSTWITLRATATDAESGLSINQPYDYYVRVWQGGSWSPWSYIASFWDSLTYYNLSPETTYAFCVCAWDNGGNPSVSAPTYLYVPRYTVITSSSPPDGGSTFPGPGGGNYDVGRWVEIGASNNPCYRFVNWTENGTEVSTVPGYYFTVTNNRTLVANFAPLTSCAVSTSSSPPEGGTTSGGGIVACATTVTVTATPSLCYAFENWLENGWEVSRSASYSFTVGTNRNLVAHFTPIIMTTLYSFSGSEGASPQAGLVQGSDGNLYGTTYRGGANDSGTVFRISPSGSFTNLYSFGGSDGAYPEAVLVQGSDGNFYGTTYCRRVQRLRHGVPDQSEWEPDESLLVQRRRRWGQSNRWSRAGQRWLFLRHNLRDQQVRQLLREWHACFGSV